MASKKLVVSVLIVTMAILFPAVALTAGPQDKSDVDLIQQKLAKKVDRIDYQGTPLSEVLDDLRARSGLNIHVDWNSLSAAIIEQPELITMQLHDVSVEKVLRLIVGELSRRYNKTPIGYVVDENVITIATKEDLAATAQAEAEFLRRELQQKLRKKIKKVDFEETQLNDAIQFLRDASGLNIHVKWGLLAEAGVENARPVNIQLRDVTAEKAVAVIVDHISTVNDTGGVRFAYVVDENVVTITSVDDLREARELAADKAAAVATAAAEAEFPTKKAEQIEMKLELIERMQKVCLDPAAVALIASAGLKDDVTRPSGQIIEDLEAQLAKTKTLGLRNAIRLTLRDLYKASSNNEKVLEHLRAMLAENDAAMTKREAPSRR